MRRTVDNPIVILLDCIRWTYFCTSRVFTMHTNYWCGLNSRGTVNEIQMDHRFPPMGITFSTSLYAGLATNAAGRIKEKLFVSWEHD